MTSDIMTDLPPNFKEIAERAGMEFAPIKGMDSHYFKLNGLGKRVLDSELEEWTADDFETFVAGFKVEPTIELIYLGLQKTARNHSRPYYVEVQS